MRARSSNLVLFVAPFSNPRGHASAEDIHAAVTPIAAPEYAAAMGCVGTGRWGRRMPARLLERAFDLGGFGNALYSILSYGPI